MKICIVGAGTAGLCSARHAIRLNFEPTIFEQTEQIGGTWVFTEKTGIQENGIEVHSSMYRNLRTNLPKEVMGYPDFQIDGTEESYVPSNRILTFLNDYADHFGLKKYIKFQTYVLRILKKGKKWQVVTKNLQTESVSFDTFDYVIVGSGHYHTPSYPDVVGWNQFKGDFLHSHDFRDPIYFKGKTVLVIGAGPSGMDLSNIISRQAKNVYISHHVSDIPDSTFFENVQQKPDVERFVEKGLYFKDGTYADCDTVFFCTGYKYAFPFLSADCGIYVQDNYVYPLYKHCINIREPTMAFIGLPFYVCAAQMMDLQIRFVLKYFSGELQLPSQSEMHADMEREMQSRWNRGLKRRQAHMMGPEQLYYYNDLAQTAQLENIKPVMTKLHNESSQRFNDNLLHFRDDIFRIFDDESYIEIK